MKMIGVTTSTSKTQYFINQAYVEYMKEAGLSPVLLYPGVDPEVVAELDGLVLPGGIDIDPIYYGDDNYTSHSVDPDKDEFEREIFHAVRTAGKPIFGICRGFQLIIREYMLHDEQLDQFLTFWTHINNHNQVNDQNLSRNIYQHFVDYVPQFLYSQKSENPMKNTLDNMPVNSMHHQCLVADFGKKGIMGIRGFQMAAWTDRGLDIRKVAADSYPVVCEAYRITGWNAPILCVQWHPEELMDTELLQNFFLGAKKPKQSVESKAAASE